MTHHNNAITSARGGHKAFYRGVKTATRHSRKNDGYRCPASERLIWRTTSETHELVIQGYWSSSCQASARKLQCTTGVVETDEHHVVTGGTWRRVRPERRTRRTGTRIGHLGVRVGDQLDGRIAACVGGHHRAIEHAGLADGYLRVVRGRFVCHVWQECQPTTAVRADTSPTAACQSITISISLRK